MKKLLVMVLCVAMMLTVLLTMAFAEEESAPVPWDGTTVDTAWYTEAPEGTKVFTIDTAEELAGLAALVKGSTSFWGKTIELGAHIDLGDKHWTPIGGQGGTVFMGEFDGNGYIISNLYIDGSKLGNKKGGLFGQIGFGGGSRRGAYLHDFTIKDTVIENIASGTGVVAGSAFHDNVLENITVDTATLTGNTPGSAVVCGVQSSQFKNIIAKNITINANKGGEIGGMFCTIQGQLGGSKVAHHANGYCLPGTIISDADNTNLSDNSVVVTYFENCVGENITINVKKANSYIGGFASYCLDSLGGDSAFFNNCDITGLKINIESTTGSPYVGGFIGLRAGVVNYKYTNTDGNLVEVGGFDGCSIAGEIHGAAGTFGGFIAQSGIYSGVSSSAVTYRNAVSNVAITAAETATVGGFVGNANTSKKINGGASAPLPQSFSGIEVLGTTKLGDGEPVGSSLIGTAITAASAGLAIDSCYASALDDLNALWLAALNAENSELTAEDEASWKAAETLRLMAPNVTGGGVAAVSASNYALRFDTNGGSGEFPTIIAAAGETIISPANNPTRSGYAFAGWVPAIPATMPEGGLTVTAQWIPIHTVSFVVNGGSSVSPVEVPEGETLSQPAAPSKSGYIFVGWYTDEELTTAYDLSTPVTEAITLYAKWVPIPTFRVESPEGVKTSAPYAYAGTPITVTSEDPEMVGVRVFDSKGNLLRVDGKDGKFSFTMPAENVRIEPFANPFEDVADSSYFHDPVIWGYANGITLGTAENSFSPDAACTRAEIVTFLWRAAGSPAASADNSFSDVDEDSYYAEAVNWAVEQGITLGVDDENFDPDSACSRAEIISFLGRFAKAGAAADSSFEDVDADAYYAAYVSWALANGITQGTDATSFSPDASCTRAQALAFLFRYFRK